MRHSSYRITRHGPVEAPETARANEPFADILWAEPEDGDEPDHPVRVMLRRGNPDSIDPQVGTALDVYPDEIGPLIQTLQDVRDELWEDRRE